MKSDEKPTKKAAESGLSSVQYVGSPEDRNSDVAEACSCSSVMEPGRIYEVPSELAGRLLDTPHFAKPTGS